MSVCAAVTKLIAFSNTALRQHLKMHFY